MKKQLGWIGLLLISTSMMFGQIQPKGFSNTVLTGISTGTSDYGINSLRDAKTQFIGFTDYFTGNISVGKITFAGDIAWNIHFDSGMKTNFLGWNTNVVINPFQGFDVGVGTNLYWTVGPGPSFGPFYSAYATPYYAGILGEQNVPQGLGILSSLLNLGNLGNLGNILGGISNSATSQTPLGAQQVNNTIANKSVGIRYTFKDIFQVGFALHDGASDQAFYSGIGAKVMIKDMASIGFVYNGSFSDKTANDIYLGASITAVKGFLIDAWWDFRLPSTKNAKDSHNLLGARLSFEQGGFMFKPEFSVTFHGKDVRLAPSMYVGLDTYMSINKEILAGLKASWGLGSDYIEPSGAQNTVKAGARLNINPYVVWNIAKNHKLSAGLHLNPVWWRTEDANGKRTSFQWALPIAWTYSF